MSFARHPENPIVTPGDHPWRQVAVFNPGVIATDGTIFLLERAAGSLRPFRTVIGLRASTDGVHFEPVVDRPVLSGDMFGFPDGSVQDARVVRIDGRYLVTYALQPYPMDCWPSGSGLPDYQTDRYPEWARLAAPMMSRSGIAVSDDLVDFTPVGFTSPADIDDRDNVLFPERIGGRYALLRRPSSYVGEQHGTRAPGIWISYSEDLERWTEPRLIARPEQPWESSKIGAGPPPIRTERGWLLLYHGVDADSVYRVGAMVLDLDDVERVIARSSKPIMEPETYYERFGLVIPRVIFPTGVVQRDDRLDMYYGCTDTAIALASASLDEVLNLTFASARIAGAEAGSS